MLIIGENQEDANILHIIIGPETDFQFNISGQSIMDVTEYVSKFKDGKKCIIVLNQCNSEEELVQELQIKQARNRAATILQQYSENENLMNEKQPIEVYEYDEEGRLNGYKSKKNKNTIKFYSLPGIDIEGKNIRELYFECRKFKNGYPQKNYGYQKLSNMKTHISFSEKIL